MKVELVAIAHAGDVYISRGEDKRLWRHARYLPGDPVQISPIEAERAIDAYGFRRLSESFGSWEDLEAHVEGLVPKVDVLAEDFPVSPLLAKALLPLLRQRVADPLAAQTVPRVVGRLLEDQRIKDDLELYSDLIGLLTMPTSVPFKREAQPQAGTRMHSFYDYLSSGEAA